MNIRVISILCLLTILFTLPVVAQDCKDWVPRFELVLHEPARGEFYEGETVVLDIWVLDVCPEVLPRIDDARFYMLKECVSWIPDCSAYSINGACCQYTDERRNSFCTGAWGCDGNLNESGARTVGNAVFQCEKSLQVQPDGRALLGQVVAFPSAHLEGLTVVSFMVGDRQSRTGDCTDSAESVIELWDRGEAIASLYPEDSEPVLVRARRRPFIRGDANHDGLIDLSDAVRILGVLFLGEPGHSFQCSNAADVDDNNRHDITDAVALLVHLFIGGAPPVAPFPEPGYDKTPVTPQAANQSGCNSGVFP